jgi:hypothetical protein
VLDKTKKLLEKIPSSSLSGLTADGTISGGMIPKLGTSFAVKSHNFTQFYLLLAFVEIKFNPAEFNCYMKRLHLMYKIAFFFLQRRQFKLWRRVSVLCQSWMAVCVTAFSRHLAGKYSAPALLRDNCPIRMFNRHGLIASQNPFVSEQASPQTSGTFKMLHQSRYAAEGTCLLRCPFCIIFYADFPQLSSLQLLLYGISALIFRMLLLVRKKS